MVLDIKNIDKEFLKRFMLQLILEHNKKEVPEEIKFKAMPKQELPFIRPFIVPRYKPIMAKPFPSASVIEEQKEKTEINGLKIDLNKLNQFVENPLVDYIECPGENQRIKIRKENFRIETDVILTKEEIGEIIRNFSEKSGIPVGEVFKASVGRLTINALISEFIGLKFIIQKI